MIGNIDHFVNRQILLWQEERRIAERKGLEAKSAQQPTICISRHTGGRCRSSVAERFWLPALCVPRSVALLARAKSDGSRNDRCCRSSGTSGIGDAITGNIGVKPD